MDRVESPGGGVATKASYGFASSGVQPEFPAWPHLNATITNRCLAVAFATGEAPNAPLSGTRSRGILVKRLALTLVLCGPLISGIAVASQSCKSKATQQKLTGEALLSFVKQCETDAQMACADQAAGKMLSGSASDRFVDTCVAKAVGAGPTWCVPHHCLKDSDCTGGAGCGVCWAGICGN